MSAPDQDIRHQALDVRQSYIVQAPAGSGKTALLIQRYLALLAHVEAPEEILAITFTRKAAAEMRQRINDALHSATQGKPATAYELLTWNLAKQAMQRAADKQWNLQEQPARLRIMTIDSFNALLLNATPWLSRTGVGATIAQSGQTLYQDAVWKMLDSRYADAATQSALQTLLVYLDNDDRRVASLLCGLLAKRDQWLRHLIPLNSEQDKRAQLTQWFTRAVEEKLADLHDRIPPDTGKKMMCIAAVGAAQLEEQGDADSAHIVCRELTQLPPPTLAAIAQWKGLAYLYLTQSGAWRSAKSFNKALGFPPKSPAKADIQILLEQLQLRDDIKNALHEVRSFPEIIYTDDEWRLLSALIKLLPVAVAHLRLVFQQYGEIDFVEQSLAASCALEQDGEATDLAMKLDYQLRHILMDEFQDTSHSQFKLLEQLLSGWQPDDGRSLFLVGDPMQSIYAFREADVSGFLRVKQRGIGNIRPQPLSLSANFRATPGLMNWFNDVFPDVLAEHDDVSLGAVSYTPAVAAGRQRADSGVVVHAGLNRNKDDEADLIIQRIRQALQRNPRQSIGVLVRLRSHLYTLYAALKAGGIDFQAVEILPLSEQPAIQDLLSVTRTLLHLHDRLAWLAVLRAPWCGLTLHSLHILTGGARDDDVWTLMRDAGIQQKLAADERRRLHKVIDCYAAVERHELTLRTKIEWLWQALGGAACYAHAAADAQAYFDVLDELQYSGADITFDIIKDTLSNAYSDDTSNADVRVQLMTIHKSKGLEFDCVMLPALERGTKSNDKQLLVWHEEQGAHYGDARLLLAPIHAPGGASPSFNFVSQREKNRGDYETQRLLYVAMTRAKNHLHLFASLKLKNDGSLSNPLSGSLLRLIYSHVEHHFQAQISAHDESQANTVEEIKKELLLQRVPLAWQPPTPGSNVDWQAQDSAYIELERVEFSWAGQIARLVGTVAHQYLYQIGVQGTAAWDEQRIVALQPGISAGLLSRGLPQSELESATQRVTRALSNTIRSEKARWILASHAEARSEYAISGIVSGKIVNRIIDRTFIDAHGDRWIIDYKISAHEGGGLSDFLDEEQARYAQQMNEYAQMFRTTDDRPVKLGLYFPLMDGWREWE